MEELLQLDEAAQCLQQEDEAVLKSEQKAMPSRRESFNAFATELRERKTAVTAAAASSSSSGGRGGQRRKKAAPADTARVRPVDLSRIEQQDAAKLMPPGGYVWQNRHGECWCSRVPPYRQVSRAWRKHGEAQALRLVMSEAWRQWAAMQGLELSSLPLQGLVFEEVA